MNGNDDSAMPGMSIPLAHPVVPRHIAEGRLRQLGIGTGALVIDAMRCTSEDLAQRPMAVSQVLRRIQQGFDISAYVAARMEVWLETPRKHPPRHQVLKDYGWPEFLAPQLHVRVHHREVDATTLRRRALRNQDPPFTGMVAAPTLLRNHLESRRNKADSAIRHSHGPL